MTREITTVGVIGLGTMGAGIVEVFARSGLTVVAAENSPELAERGRGLVSASTARLVSKERMTQDEQDDLLGRITFTDRFEDLAAAHLVIEAVPERLEIKREVFARLDALVAPETILASNTSSLSMTEIAAGTAHPERVVGMHFFNPAPVLKLVEVITTVLLDEQVSTAVHDLALRLGKKPVVVGDRAGFVANALLITYIARAIRLLEAKRVTREDLDEAARLGIGLPMGPLTLADLIGLDVVLEVCDVLYAASHEPSSAPPTLLRHLVAAGRLGRKSGHGFYRYDRPGSGAVADSVAAREVGAPAPRVGVVGRSESAGDLATRLSDGGIQTTHISDPAADLGPLSELPLVVLVDDDGHVCEDCGNGDCMLENEDDPLSCSCCHGGSPAVWFSRVDDVLGEHTVVANVSDQPASLLAVTPTRQVVPISLHTAGQVGHLAEVVVPFEPDPAAVDVVEATLRAAGLHTIRSADRAGRVVGALLHPHLHDAVKMLDSGYATVADIDTAMTAGCGYPQGPLAIVDQIGAEALYHGLIALLEETGDPMHTPSPLLVEHLRAERPFGS